MISVELKVSMMERDNSTSGLVQSSWNVMTHGDTREGKWTGSWRMVWVASTLHTTSELGVSSITTADAHTSAASSRLNWRPCRFKLTRPWFLLVCYHISNAVYSGQRYRVELEVGQIGLIFIIASVIANYLGSDRFFLCLSLSARE